MGFKVQEEKCDQCLFTDNKVVSDKRKVSILKTCVREDRHFVCHKTDDVCCKGFYEKFDSQMIRIAQRMGAVEFVKVDNKKVGGK